MNSIINISLQFQVVKGALLCTICDVTVTSSTMIFVASGQQLSGLLIESKQLIQLTFSFISYKFVSTQSSGIVNIINSKVINFSIIESKISGYNFYIANTTGYISGTVIVNMQVNFTNLEVCVMNTTKFGLVSLNVIIDQIGIESLQCVDICGSLILAYGLCVDQFNYSQINNDVYQCLYPFEYSINQCICAEGYLLNDSQCLSIVNELTNIQSSITQGNEIISNLQQNINQLEQTQIEMYKNINQYIQDNVSVLDKRIVDNMTILNQKILTEDNKLLQKLVDNSSVLEKRIISNASEIYQKIADNITILNNKLSQAIIGNFTALDKRIQDNITAINQSILSGYNILLQNIIDNTTRLDQRIFQNVSNLNSLISNTTAKLTQNIQDNTTNLDKRIAENITNVYSTISSGNSKLLQNIVDNSTILDSMIFNNVSSLNKTLIDNVTTIQNLILNLQEQIDLLQNKQDKLPLEMLDNMFHQDNYEATELWVVCGQPTFIQTFDITSVTNTIIASNFTNGSVFGSLINVQSAFIDIQGGVYTSIVQPLFAAQNQFYNIKVQVGTQIVGSGQILSGNKAIIINQLCVLSKVGTIINVNSMLQLNILQTQSINTNIKDMKVNLDVEASTGNLGLIGSLTGQMNIINYEVSGTYETQGSMSLGASILSSSKVIVKHVNFAPKSYFYGNQSSYLFRIVSSSNVEISRCALSIGEEANKQNLGQVTSTNSLYQQFGGLVAQMTSSTLIVAEITYISYFTCSTEYMMKSGLLLGISNSASSRISFNKICVSTIIDANTTFIGFGIIGIVNGNITIQQGNINFYISSLSVTNFGVIGNVTSSSQISSIFDLQLTYQIYCTSGGIISALIGQIQSQISKFLKIQLNNSITNQTGVFGGFIAVTKSSVSITDCTIYNISILTTGNSGAVTGQSSINMIIYNILIMNCQINSSSFVGGIVGSSDSDITLENGISSNHQFVSGQNLGGFIGIVSVGRYITTLNANSSDMLIISLTTCSAGTIIGLTQANNTISNSYTTNINISNVNGGQGSGSIIGYSINNATLINCHSENIIIDSICVGTGGIIGQSNLSFIMNCYVINARIMATTPTGGIAGILNNISSIISCQFNNNSIEAASNVGGIVSISRIFVQIRNSSSINCNLTSDNSVVGGIISTGNQVIIEWCYVNYLNTLSGAQSGGILGISSQQGVISIQFVTVQNSHLQCKNGNSVGSVIGIAYVDATINGANMQNISLKTVLGAYGAGGVVGYSISTIQIINCVVDKLFILSEANGSAGIMGQSNITTIINCSVSNAIINSSRQIGGIVGYQISNTTVLDSQMLLQNVSVHNVSMTSPAYTGGLIGFYDSVQDLVITSSSVFQIQIFSPKAGMVFGKSLSGNYSVVDSGSEGENKINGVLVQNCANFQAVAGSRGC
ncbi:Conserved_hypothetical protein [Hexamita inflata]|uniref:Uncharacterized protein n=1 Tax=Hexamita inflata TaxID=28002 RepID=A0ABP1JIG5_9EUKA